MPQLDVTVGFAVDQSSKAQAQQAIQDVQAGTGTGSPSGATQAAQQYGTTLEENIAIQDQWAKENGVVWDDATQRWVDAQNQLKEVGSATDDLTTRTTNFGYQGARAFRMAADGVNIVSTAILAGGVAIDGAITLLANNYIKKTGDVTDLTTQWTAAQNELAAAGQKAGAVFAQQELPFMQKAADFATMMADNLQKFPVVGDVVGAVGALMIAVGTVGKAVSSGVRLYADYEYITSLMAHTTAETAMIPALNAHTAAMTMFNAEGGIGAAEYLPGGAGAAGGLSAGIAAGIASPLGAGALIAGTIVSAIALNSELDKMGTQFDSLTSKGSIFSLLFADFRDLVDAMLPVEGSVHNFEIAIKGLMDLIPKSPPASSSITDNTTLKTARDATETYLNGISDAVAKEAQSELTVKQDLAQKELDIANKEGQAIVNAQQNYADQVAKIVANGALQDQNALENYQAQRAQTIRDANIQIADVEQQLQNKLYDLQVSHNDKLWDLGLKRDALGIEKENQSYDQQKAQDIRDANQTIAKDRQQEAIRLQDQADAFARSEQQRHAQEAQQLADAKVAEDKAIANAQQSADDQLQVAQDAAQKQLDTLRQNLSEQEKTLQNSYAKQMYSLGMLTGNLEAQWNAYYAWLDQRTREMMSGGMGSNFSPNYPNSYYGGMHDYSGMAYPGMYAMAQNGVPQFVLSGSATSMAERIAGSQLNESMILSALSGGAGGQGISITQQFYGDYSSAQQRMMEQAVLNILSRVMR